MNKRHYCLLCLFFLLSFPAATVGAAEQNNGSIVERNPLLITARDLVDPKNQLPKNEVALSTELERVNKAIDDILQYEYSMGYDSYISAVDKAFKEMDDAASKIKLVDCKGDFIEAAVREYNNGYSDLLTALKDSSFPTNFGKIILPPRAPGANLIEYCQNLKQLTESQINADRDDLHNTIKAQLNDAQARYQQLVKNYNEVLPQLRARKNSIVEAIDRAVASSAQQSISDQVPVILAIIGAACIAVFVGLKLFGEQLQMEWVASGQIIQFMTVMILLSVIMALGLAKIIQENTLGTLLGGVAGYVLAQGVGRQAARDATRGGPTAQSAAASPAAPAPPPGAPAEGR